ncbi:Pyridoxal kinase PdxY [Alphaproteobacteria bacterium SO-S41]|nr:Pyridoxal kinase PdxY [Alphaproteobacteria bacterium SO-S41]
MQTSDRMKIPRPPRVLSIQSEVVHGHVGNAAARFALQRLGVDLLALPTVLFSNHPGHGGFSGGVTPVAELDALLEGLEARGFLDGVDAVLSGYLGSADQAETVRAAVLSVKRRNPGAIYLLDPVFGDEGGAYARPGVAEAMAKHLLPLADIVTPNRFELASLTSRRIEDAAAAVSAARTLGRKLVLATSVPGAADEIGTAAITPDRAWLAMAARAAHAPSGTGDLLAALFLGWQLKGEDVPAALARATGAVAALIAASGTAKDLALIAGQDALLTARLDPTLLA